MFNSISNAKFIVCKSHEDVERCVKECQDDSCKHFIRVLDILCEILLKVGLDAKGFQYYSLYSIVDRLLFELIDSGYDCIIKCSTQINMIAQLVESVIGNVHNAVKKVLDEILKKVITSLCKVHSKQESCDLVDYILFPTPFDDIGNIPQLTKCVLRGEE